MVVKEFTLEWCKTYDVKHIVRVGDRKYQEVWERLTFCTKCCNGQKPQFWNAETMKRCRLSITAIKVICDDVYQYNIDAHKNLIDKVLKGGTI